LRRLFALVVALIVYGSLYPWRFEARELDGNPLWILANAWAGSFNRYLPRDLLVNVALYAPLGMTGRLAFGGYLRPIAIGVALSAALEMLQLFVPGRNTSAMDVLTNAAGTALGVALAPALERGASRYRTEAPADSGALALLACWITYLLFPFFPVGWYVFRGKISALTHAPLFSLVPFASAAMAWLLAGRLLAAAGVRPVWLAAVALAAPAQLLIVDRRPAPSDLWGAATA
jgi:glycopeptide antibiotics resistance protein